VGGNAWERRSQARHFCNLAFRGLKERFFCHENARLQAGTIVIAAEFSNEPDNLNLVKITA